MSRLVSFIVLVAVLLVIATMFFVVMAGFILPMFLALLVVVIFQPLHRWFREKCRGHHRMAAGLTTACIVLIVLLPLLGIFAQAVTEGLNLYWAVRAETARAAQRHGRQENAAEPDDRATGTPEAHRESFTDALVNPRVLAAAAADTADRFGFELSVNQVETAIRDAIERWVGPVALGTARFSGSLLLGGAVMVISIYYFLADGPWMVRKIMVLSPLDDRYEEQLFEEFVRVSRAVVLATLLSAFVQGLLAGVGFFALGMPAVFLLTALTMLLAMVPFVGAAAVWVPVAVWLFFFGGRPVAAVLLTVYGAGIISMADNVIKPLVLHGRSNMHPLLALLSVIGGVQALGPIGIFVGPMVVAFLHALLNMLHGELEEMGEKGPDTAIAGDQQAGSREGTEAAEPSTSAAGDHSPPAGQIAGGSS